MEVKENPRKCETHGYVYTHHCTEDDVDLCDLCFVSHSDHPMYPLILKNFPEEVEELSKKLIVIDNDAEQQIAKMKQEIKAFNEQEDNGIILARKISADCVAKINARVQEFINVKSERTTKISLLRSEMIKLQKKVDEKEAEFAKVIKDLMYNRKNNGRTYGTMVTEWGKTLRKIS